MRRDRIVVWTVAALIVATGLFSACAGAEDTPAGVQPTVDPLATAAPAETVTAPLTPTEEPTTAAIETQAEVLLQERCTPCHGLERVRAAGKTPEEWEETIENMIARGAQLNEEEKSVLVAYLSETQGPP